MDKKVSLSGRMEMLLKLAGAGTTLSDVGCDHGYVTIAAVQRGLFERAIAMDINKGPLEAAKANAKSYGVFEKVEFRLSNGLQKLELNEADTILIAGMGGPLVCDILRAKMDVAKNARKLILSPQSEIPEFRKFVLDNGFDIEDEDIIKDEGKFYFAFRIAKSKNAIYPKGDLGIKFGGFLLERKHPVLKEYLEWQKNVVSKLLEKEGIKNTPKADAFIEELELINESMESFFG